MKQPFGDRIKKLRKERGISQRELARLTGISQQMISKLERNQAVGTSHIVAVAWALGTNAEELIGPLPPGEPVKRFLKEDRRVGQTLVTSRQYELLQAYDSIPELRRAIDALLKAYKDDS